MLECVVNVSEGVDHDVIGAMSQVCGDDLLDVHTDPHHNRSVFTLVGTDAPRRLTAAAVDRLDITTHSGVHPRIGVVDVVPFVPLAGSSLHDALTARDAFARWAADELGLPCFLYGPKRSLPTVRREAFGALAPDFGPDVAHPTAGACAVGARDLLVAYNVWVDAPGLQAVRAVARAVRSSTVRTLGLRVGDRYQVSCNLTAPAVTGPAQVTASVAAAGRASGVVVVGCELVGLIPESVLDQIEGARRGALDVSEDRTIEARLAARAGR